MLIGEQSCTMDDKGRLNFPSRFRDDMGDTFIIARWLDNCIVAFPNDEWQRIATLLKERSEAKTRNIRRYLFASANEVEPDKQGRILIPAALRQHAGLEKDIVIIGAGSHAEIWSADAWRQLNDDMDSDDIALAMEELEF